RSTTTAPSDLRRYVAYGYGDDGELLLARRFGRADGEVRDERFWTAAKDGASIQLMVVPAPGGERGVAHLLRPIWNDGVLVGVDMRFRDRLSSGGWSRERYGYDSGRVTRIE